ncbi:GroES-like protein [Atractiella rhizophila]|nr:GroES-like protein [Atractiella rhizophila]
MVSTQKALVIPFFQGGWVVQSRDVPAPAEGEVVIKVMAAGLNPVDAKRHDSGMYITSYPCILGSDIAGTVQAVGRGVSRLKVGDRVMVGTMGGGFQQYVAVSEQIVFPIPDNVSFEEAATIPVCYGTMIIGVMNEPPRGLGLNPTFSMDQPCKGKRALIIGGSSTVGIQVFKFLGFSEIVAYASNKHTAYLTSIGATQVLDRSSVSLRDLSSLYSDLDVVVDAVLGTEESQGVALDCLKPGGGLINLTKSNHTSTEWRSRTENKTGFHVFSQFTNASIREHALQRLPELLKDRILVGARYEVLPGGLSAVSNGLERYKKNEVSGIKLVIHPFEE